MKCVKHLKSRIFSMCGCYLLLLKSTPFQQSHRALSMGCFFRVWKGAQDRASNMMSTQLTSVQGHLIELGIKLFAMASSESDGRASHCQVSETSGEQKLQSEPPQTLPSRGELQAHFGLPFCPLPFHFRHAATWLPTKNSRSSVQQCNLQ